MEIPSRTPSAPETRPQSTASGVARPPLRHRAPIVRSVVEVVGGRPLSGPRSRHDYEAIELAGGPSRSVYHPNAGGTYISDEREPILAASTDARPRRTLHRCNRVRPVSRGVVLDTQSDDLGDINTSDDDVSRSGHDRELTPDNEEGPAPSSYPPPPNSDQPDCLAG